MEYKDYYKILGVTKASSEKDIKKAYRNLARQYHPDHNPNNAQAEAKFKEINEAYEVIGTPENRKKYDQLGRNYHRWKQAGGAASGFDPSQFPGGGNINLDDLFGQGGGGSFADIFSQIFGNQTNGSPFQSAQPLRQDSEQTIEITLHEAYNGSTRTMVDANGDRFTVKIPAGSKTGTKVRLKGKGSRGGDLYLILKERLHPAFKRIGDSYNLETTVKVDVLTAILGGEVKIETLKGPINLKILPGSQGGRTLRLRGRGMPNLKQKDVYGHLLAHINIVVPEDLSAAERDLYEQLAALR